MVNLVRNENMKLYRRWRTWIMAGLMVGAVLLGSIVDWYYDGKEASADGWREQITEEKAQLSGMLADEELPAEVRADLQNRIAVIDYRLANDIRPEDGTMWDGIYNSAELVILITLFTVIAAGDSLAGEFSTGTIKLLLIRPASRFKILLSKYIALILFGLLLLVMLFVVSVIVNGLLYSFGHLNLPLVTVNGDGQPIERNMVANLWQTYALNGVSTVIFVTMAFMISSAFRSSAMAIGVSIFLLFAGAAFLELLHRYAWSKYLLFANIDLSQYLFDRPYQEGMTMAFSLGVLAVYFIAFNLVSWLVFTKRDVAA